MTRAEQELMKFQEQARDIRGRCFRKIPALVTRHLYEQNDACSARAMRVVLQYVLESFRLQDCGNLTYRYQAGRARRTTDDSIIFNYRDLDKWFLLKKTTPRQLPRTSPAPLVAPASPPLSDFDLACPHRQSFRKALNWLRRAGVLEVEQQSRGCRLGSCLLLRPCFSRIHEILTLSGVPELVDYVPSLGWSATDPQPLKTKQNGFQLFSKIYRVPETVRTALGQLRDCLREYRDDALTVARLQQAIVKGFAGKHLTLLEIQQLHVEVTIAGGPGNARYSENEDAGDYQLRCHAADASGNSWPRWRRAGQRRFAGNLTVDQFRNCPLAIREDLRAWQEQGGGNSCFYANWVPDSAALAAVQTLGHPIQAL